MVAASVVLMHLRLVSLVGFVAACLLLASAAFGVTGSADAQETQVTCPAGWTVSADGTQCLSDAVNDNVVTSTSCLQGVLSADGQTCVVPRLDAAPAPAAGGTNAGTGGAVTAPVPTFTG